jgi:hypothetical protein
LVAAAVLVQMVAIHPFLEELLLVVVEVVLMEAMVNLVDVVEELDLMHLLDQDRKEDLVEEHLTQPRLVVLEEAAVE